MAKFDEVYYCGRCDRQQGIGEGIRCKICSSTTVSWNLATQKSKDAKDSWTRVNGSGAKKKEPSKRKPFW